MGPFSQAIPTRSEAGFERRIMRAQNQCRVSRSNDFHQPHGGNASPFSGRESVAQPADSARSTLRFQSLWLINSAISIAEHAEADVEHFVVGSVIHTTPRRASFGTIIERPAARKLSA